MILIFLKLINVIWILQYLLFLNFFFFIIVLSFFLMLMQMQFELHILLHFFK